MSEIVDKALALMLRHAANEAPGYSEKRQPGPGLASVASQTPAQGFRQPYAHLTGCPGRS